MAKIKDDAVRIASSATRPQGGDSDAQADEGRSRRRRTVRLDGASVGLSLSCGLCKENRVAGGRPSRVDLTPCCRP